MFSGLESESSSSGSVPGPDHCNLFPRAFHPLGKALGTSLGLSKCLCSYTHKEGKSSGNELASKQPMRARGAFLFKFLY